MALGVSPRRLWGWEPSTITEYEYDDAGRIIRATANPEPEYSEEDLVMLAAWRELDAETGSYGENLLEAFSPESDPNNPKATHKYVAGETVAGEQVPLVNYAEKALLDARDRYSKKYPNVSTNGHHWPVQRVERAR